MDIPDQISIDEKYTKPALTLIQKAVKGNGVRASDVKIKHFDGQILEFKAATHVTLNNKISNKTTPGRAAGSNIFPTPQAALAEAQNHTAKALQDPAAIEQIKNTIDQKPHNGFGLDNQSINLPFLDQDFISHEPCKPCHGNGRTKCEKCKGSGYEPCRHCEAQGFEKCHECHGNRQVRGPQGQMQTCNLCQGLGKTSCSFCKEKREVPCSICKTKGENQCRSCGGQGAQSHIVSVEISAQCAYDYDQNALPDKAVNIIKTMGEALAEHAKITPEKSETDESIEDETLHFLYNVSLPQGNADITIKDETIKAYLFGTQSNIQDIPDFLDDMLAPGIKKLSQAASTNGSIDENIRAAIKYKTIRQAMTLTARYKPKKALKALMHYTPLGLRAHVAQTLIQDANTALNNATKKQTQIARISGIATTITLGAPYYLSPIRQILLSQIANPSLHIPANILAFVLCAAIGYGVWQTISSHAREQALKKFISAKKKPKQR